jgi:SpoVK/Ycf46/Vps4 family AAA+-type ATPase
VRATLQESKTEASPILLVAVSSELALPAELDKEFAIVEHALPGRNELKQIAEKTDPEAYAATVSDKRAIGRTLDAAIGLSRTEAEAAFALSGVKYKKLDPTAIWQYKAQAIKKSAALSLYSGDASFENLGGLAKLKEFLLALLNPSREITTPDLRALGVLLLGVPGTGKSEIAKALGNETGRPTLQLDMGSIFASLVGESERNLRQALRIVDAMAPCILFIDEVEKGLSGAESGGRSDSGVTTRLFGGFLTWLSDHVSDVFLIATSNDISKLPSAFLRAGRFDGIFFLDLPGEQQREKIWEIYLKRFGHSLKSARPPSTDWTGAEIRACCRLAAMLQVSLVEAAKTVVPVAKMAQEQTEALRCWADGRATSPETGIVYCRKGK